MKMKKLCSFILVLGFTVIGISSVASAGEMTLAAEPSSVGGSTSHLEDKTDPTRDIVGVGSVSSMNLSDGLLKIDSYQVDQMNHGQKGTSMGCIVSPEVAKQAGVSLAELMQLALSKDTMIDCKGPQTFGADSAAITTVEVNATKIDVTTIEGDAERLNILNSVKEVDQTSAAAAK